MHAYNVQFDAKRSLLLYPKVSGNVDVDGTFAATDAISTTFDHRCGMAFLELFDGDKLRHDLGQDVIGRLKLPM